MLFTDARLSACVQRVQTDVSVFRVEERDLQSPEVVFGCSGRFRNTHGVGSSVSANFKRSKGTNILFSKPLLLDQVS